MLLSSQATTICAAHLWLNVDASVLPEVGLRLRAYIHVNQFKLKQNTLKLRNVINYKTCLQRWINKKSNIRPGRSNAVSNFVAYFKAYQTKWVESFKKKTGKTLKKVLHYASENRVMEKEACSIACNHNRNFDRRHYTVWRNKEKITGISSWSWNATGLTFSAADTTLDVCRRRNAEKSIAAKIRRSVLSLLKA